MVIQNPDSWDITGSGRVIVQYWRSFEHFEAYARAKDKKHWPAWVDFNRRLGNSRGDVGIWHETYRVKPGNYEAVTAACPALGSVRLASWWKRPGKREAARSRMTAGAASEQVSP